MNTSDKIDILDIATKDLERGLFCRRAWFQDPLDSDADLASNYVFPIFGDTQSYRVQDIKDWLKCAEGSLAYATATLGLTISDYREIRDFVESVLADRHHIPGISAFNDKPYCFANGSGASLSYHNDVCLNAVSNQEAQNDLVGLFRDARDELMGL